MDDTELQGYLQRAAEAVQAVSDMAVKLNAAVEEIKAAIEELKNKFNETGTTGEPPAEPVEVEPSPPSDTSGSTPPSDTGTGTATPPPDTSGTATSESPVEPLT